MLPARLPRCDPHNPKQLRQEPKANSLPHEEAVDGFLLPHHLDNLPVQVDEERAPKATGNAAEGSSAAVKRRLPSRTPARPRLPRLLTR